MGWQTKTDTQLGSVSLLHIVYKAHAKFTTGSDAHVSQTAMPQVSTLRPLVPNTWKWQTDDLKATRVHVIMIKVWLSSPVTRIKPSANSTYIHFSSSHIMFTLRVYDLTFIYKGRGDGGGVTEEKAAEPVISDGCWVSTFVSVKNLDHFKGTSRVL